MSKLKIPDGVAVFLHKDAEDLLSTIDKPIVTRLLDNRHNEDFLCSLIKIDSWFKGYTCRNPVTLEIIYIDSYTGQWATLLTLLINSARLYSKGTVAEFKDHERLLRDKVKRISSTAEKLSKLMRDAEEIGER